MEEQNGISWTHLTVYRSLTEYILVMGVPRTAMIINGMVGAFFLLYFSFYYILVVNIVFHVLCKYLSQDDAQFFDCFNKYIYKSNYYST